MCFYPGKEIVLFIHNSWLILQIRQISCPTQAIGTMTKILIPPSSGTPSSLRHSVTTISLLYLRSSGEPPDSRSLSISVTPFHKIYTYPFSRQHWRHPKGSTSVNATFAPFTLQSFHFVPTIPMLFSSAFLPSHNALILLLRLRLTYLSGACSITSRCVHPFR